jgi:hypothetical protein
MIAMPIFLSESILTLTFLSLILFDNKLTILNRESLSFLLISTDIVL